MDNAIRRAGAAGLAAGLLLFCTACPTEPNGQTLNENDNTPSGDATAGEQLFTTDRTSQGGAELACAGCHADDGSGGVGPDIRGEDADHLQEHGTGDGPHPDGVKFAELTAENYAGIAAYLAQQCADDPECSPGEGEPHDHDDEAP